MTDDPLRHSAKARLLTSASAGARRGQRNAQIPASKYTLHGQPGFLLRVVLRRHTSFFSRMMVEGLTAPQFSTLAKLYEVGICSQNRLGRLISFDSATITGVVERLRGRKLIVSRDDPIDRRRRALELTPEGRRVAELAITRVTEISRETFAPLSSAERATLTRLLQKIADADGTNEESHDATAEKAYLDSLR